MLLCIIIASGRFVPTLIGDLVDTLVINLTPHSIGVLQKDRNGDIFGTYLNPDNKKACAWFRSIVSFPTAGVARAESWTTMMDDLEVGGHSLGVVETTYGTVKGLPDFKPDTYYIISAIAARAAKAGGRTTSDLLLPSDPVRDDEGRVIGCTRFARL